MDALAGRRQLKNSIRANRPVFGTFVRTPAVQTVEALGRSGFDFLVLDAEHAPFGTSELDHCILAARSVAVPVLVRLGDPRPATILQVLDMGAAGIIVPHVDSAETARAAIDACRYKGGSRGFSGQHRDANYGTLSGKDYRKASDEAVIVIAQIEDAAGLANIAEISGVDDLDAILIGRADLAVSLDCENIDDAEVSAATDSIIATSNKSDMTAGIFLPVPQGIEAFREQGVNLFFIATDQSLLIDAATNVARDFAKATGRSK